MTFKSTGTMWGASAWLLAAVVVAAVAGCSSAGDETAPEEEPPLTARQMSAEPQAEPAANGPPGDESPPEEAAMAMVTSAFADGEPIPQRFTADGEDISPPLSFSGVPRGTKQLALICDDPDAPTPEPWVHWVIYGVAPETAALPEGVARTERPEQVPGAMQGVNSWPEDNLGYRGPAPPKGHGTHHYFFKLYALGTALELQPGLTKDELLAAIEGHVLTEAQLMGTYERK